MLDKLSEESLRINQSLAKLQTSIDQSPAVAAGMHQELQAIGDLAALAQHAGKAP